jgi:23S rRNA pseudouridine955/2504/2580 synthase
MSIKSLCHALSMVNILSSKCLKIDTLAAGQRLDNFLISYYKKIPKSRLYRAVRSGEVRVNKKRIKPSYRLRLLDVVRLPPLRTAMKKPISEKVLARYQFLSEHILYEDRQIMVINKPSGIPVHGGSFLYMGIIEALNDLYPQLKYLRLVHRLDRHTSGCLLLAKKRSVLLALQQSMIKRQPKKRYWVLVKGVFPTKKRIVNLPLIKNHLQSNERIVKVDAAGKQACTIFTLKEQFKDAALLEAVIVTGRTHQIRVHAHAIGHPVAGDDKYGDRLWNQSIKNMGLKRFFLHAYSIQFQLQGQKFQFKAPLPVPLQKLLIKFRTQ